MAAKKQFAKDHLYVHRLVLTDASRPSQPQSYLEDDGSGNLKVFNDAGVGVSLSATDLALIDGITAGTVAASKAVVVNANKDAADFRNLAATNLDAGKSGTAGTVDIFPATAAKGKAQLAVTDNAGDTTTSLTVGAQAAARVYTVPDAGADAAFDLIKGNAAAAGGAGWTGTLVARKTGIANNTATDVITITVPNANHNAAVFLDIMAHLGTGTDASESTRVATGVITIARTTGAATVAVASTLAQTAIATVAGGGTLTLAYGVSSITGAVGATQTFTIQVTLVVTGTITDHTAMIFARSLNSAAAGITMSASA